MKVKIDCDKRLKERGGTEYEGGWFYGTLRVDESGRADWDMKSEARFETYAAARAGARVAGYEIDNAGWKKKLLMWNWHSHSLDGYPGWQAEKEEYGRPVPAYAKLEHINKKTKSSDDLCNAWDDVAEVDFYQRDYSYDGSVFVGDGDKYGSGWWFATVAERDRFLLWAAEQMK